MSGYPQPVYYAPQPQVVMMQQPQVIVVQQAAAKPSGQWKGDCSFSPYTCCCPYCAAADVSEAIHPGSWFSYCCCLIGQGFIPGVGYCVNVCKVLGTRKALAQRDGVVDDLDFLSAFCCFSCYINQELQHIKFSNNGQNKA